MEDRISWLNDKIDIIEKKNRRLLRQKTQEVWKEYTRTLWFHQNTKPVNHGHWWRRRDASLRYM
jgi:hypothetical protein